MQFHQSLARATACIEKHVTVVINALLFARTLKPEAALLNLHVNWVTRKFQIFQRIAQKVAHF